MTKLFLAAGVAALAIAAPASAERGGKGGGDRQRVSSVERGGGGQRAQRIERRGGGGDRVRAARAERPVRAARVERQQMRASRSDRQQVRASRADRQQVRASRVERQQLRASRIERQQVRASRIERQQVRGSRIERQQARGKSIDRQQLRANRVEQARASRIDRIDSRAFERQQRQAQRIERMQGRMANRDVVRLRDWNDGNRWDRGVRMGWAADCPPGLQGKGCMPPGQQMKADRMLSAQAFRQSRLARMAFWDDDKRFIAPLQAVSYVGQPLSTVSSFVTLAALPSTVSYLYPDTDDYYYRYGGGYMYRVDRDNDLISWILPALAGGFLPGQYLPTSYMSSYVPASYGFNSFYPDTPYDCNRYVNGVIYEVDCYTGLIEDVVPLYANGYGVGQMLPSSYAYYNVPTQYRSLYYDTDDYNYWYAPGAIYQYDTKTSLITSVAALLAPGLTVGQPLPMGYNVYNVPYQYRSTYYDTPNAWYRYNNGYIYQVDPTTQLVTAIVASILT